MLASDIIDALEGFAPGCYQESYDNSGLQVGNMNSEIQSALLSLDITEAVLDEARQKGCNMVIAHHPIIFSGLKRLSGNGYVERVVEKAIRENILLYAAHTNLDNARAGVNAIIAEKMGLQQTRVLQAMRGKLLKLYTYVPKEAADALREALFGAGAGAIGQYEECSYNSEGKGSFRPGAGTHPVLGTAGGPREWVEEVKLEVLVPQHLEGKVLRKLKEAHPYEEVAYEFIRLENENPDLGAGLIGTLPEAMDGLAFLSHVQQVLKTGCIRHTQILQKPIQTVALCGGAGSFLLKQALASGADAFISADYKYHQFFDADGHLLIADIGHWESEQFTPELFQRLLAEKLPTFATLLSETKTNPVHYFCC
ncbi:MAG: Nif3-like dinuclear metal center hexameric protein [Bacteroidetes bacterium]|nr:Nif3-like dinuclear metal center hexameric protein [Bacteroidota bacterium]